MLKKCGKAGKKARNPVPTIFEFEGNDAV